MASVTPKPHQECPLPTGLNQTLAQPQTPWNVSSPLFGRIKTLSSDQSFKLCEVLTTDPEYNFILKYFEHQKPADFGIKKILCIHHPNQTSFFESGIQNIENECKNPVFQPKGKQEEPKADRARVISRWEQQVVQFSPVEIKNSSGRGAETYSKVKVLPLWHGSSQVVCQSVCSSGFTSFGKHHFFDENATKGGNKSTDKGYFGSGIYFTNSAQYATMYSSEGHLLLAWVSMREPYPVVNDAPHPQKGSDMKKLEGKEHYQNYNAHFIPVSSIKPQDPKCLEYYPCYKDQAPSWDEFVVFEKAQTLPRFWVELGVDFPKVALSQMANVGELLTLLLSLLNKHEIKSNTSLASILQAKIDRLLALPETTPLEAEDDKFYKLAKRVLEGEKVNTSVVSLLLKNETAAPSNPKLKPVSLPVAATPPTLPPRQKPLPPTPGARPKISQPVSASKAPSSLPMKEASTITSSLPAIAFGKAEWEKYIGDVGDEPPLPSNIHQILQSPCPFFPDKKVEETHLLILIPKTVNGRALTLNHLLELMKHPKQSHIIKYQMEIQEYGDIPIQNSYWVLLTKDIIPESRPFKHYNEQVLLLKKYCQNANVSYEVPRLLETAAGLFLEYLRTGKWTYNNSISGTFTFCQEQLSKPSASDMFMNISTLPFVIVGIYANYNKLVISSSSIATGIIGMGASRKLSEEKTESEKKAPSAGEISANNPSPARVDNLQYPYHHAPYNNPSYPSPYSYQPSPSQQPGALYYPQPSSYPYPYLPHGYPTSSPASSVTPYPAHYPYNPSVNPANYAHLSTHAYSPYSSEQQAVYVPPGVVSAPAAMQGGNIIYTPQAAVPSIPPASPATPFGKDLWEKHIGEVGVEPPLPSNIQEILQSPCPFWPVKRVIETHLLTLIPKTVNGKPLTLNYLQELVKQPKLGQPTKYSTYWAEIRKEYGTTPIERSYWVLLTKDVIPGSRNKSCEAQAQLLKECDQKANASYELPGLLEIATSLLMEYLRTGQCLYSYNPLTSTRCRERVSSDPDMPLAVGNFTSNGLFILNNYSGDAEFSGIGVLRKFL
jgi:hypothetical protein